MKERPIIFSGEMVRAILDGRKMMTRRVVKNMPSSLPGWWKALHWASAGHFIKGAKEHCPYGQPGDRLWVRESWCQKYDRNSKPVYGTYLYKADDSEVFKDDGDGGMEVNLDGTFASPWISPRYMPRRASRVTLEITGVRVEKIQDISSSDSVAEGISQTMRTEPTSVERFHELWDSINDKRGFGWDANPWVWVIEFKKSEST